MVAHEPNDIFQFSTYSALRAGFTRGKPQVSNLLSYGTDGVGALEDGRLLTLSDCEAYSVDDRGNVSPADKDARLAFVMVTIFRPLRAVRLAIPSKSYLDDLLSNKIMDSLELGGANSLLPLHIQGKFKSMKVARRYVIRREEDEFELKDVEGMVFGFMVPPWMEGICGPRIHFHLLGTGPAGEEGGPRIGGKVLEFETDGAAVISLAECERFHLGFPQGKDWEELDLVGSS
ncbi:hypothetical protein M011DRAFT_222764 [Sporormia fimetaria CBS 119925]|uniref:Alpha-acetolactate decarboxylase n=1 Tax=Sporormia fimetaria CBS 119925 TaxID=1340428 RepID=A0A6A6UYM8_9PLEO|nr:hypothetical protein M011DRAFT_222764 [Sporormia fimetaria CBS 119925]